MTLKEIVNIIIVIHKKKKKTMTSISIANTTPTPLLPHDYQNCELILSLFFGNISNGVTFQINIINYVFNK